MSKFSLKPVFKYLLTGLVSVLLLLAISAYWLLGTAGGAKWLWGQVVDGTGGSVSGLTVSGDLSSGFTIQGFQFHSEELGLVINRATVQAGLAWWPFSVQVESLTLHDLVIRHQPADGQSETDGQKTDIPSLIESLQLPVPVRIDNASIRNISLESGKEAPLVLAESLEFVTMLDDRLVLSLEVLAGNVDASLEAGLQLQSPYALELALAGSYKVGNAPAADTSLPFKLVASGHPQDLQVELSSTAYDLEIGGRLYDMADEPGWDVSGSAEHFKWPLAASTDSVSLSAVSLQSRGHIDDWFFEAESGLGFDKIQNALLRVKGSGSASAVHIDSAHISGSGLDMEYGGNVQWSPGVDANLNAIITQMDLSPWLEDWHKGRYLRGEFGLSYSGSGLEIAPSTLSVEGTDLEATISAVIDVDSNTIDGALSWNDLAWPIFAAEPDFVSPHGSLRINGGIDGWLGDGTVDLQSAEYPRGSFDIGASGDRTSANLTILDSQVLGGQVSGDARADWGDDLVWDAALSIRNLDPGPILEGWPGGLDSELHIAAWPENDRIEVNIASLSGSLRGVPINGSGAMVVDGGSVDFDQLELATDEAVLQLDGSLADTSGLSLVFTGELPPAFADGATGRLDITGRLSGNSNNPVTDLELEGLDLAWNDLGIGRLTVETTSPGAGSSLPDIQLQAASLHWQDLQFDQLSLGLQASGDKQRLDASLASDKLVLSAAALLDPQSLSNPAGGFWRGVLNKLELALDETYNFRLREPVAFEWSPESMAMELLCLEESAGAATCLKADYRQNDRWSLVADVNAISLDYLRNFLEMDVRFEQQVDGRLELQQVSDQAVSGTGNFTLTAGQVIDIESNDVLTRTSDGRFGFLLRDGNLESGVLDLGFSGDSFIDVDFDVLDIMPDGRRALHGRALIHLGNIDVIGHQAIPAVDKFGGSFDSNIQLGGTLDDPTLSGSFSLRNGLVHHVPLGMKLEEVEIEGRLEQRGRGSLKGKFKAGEGVGSIEGSLEFEDFVGLGMDISLAGEQLLLVDTGNLRVLTNTDLDFSLAPGRLDINGRVAVPSARVTPGELVLDRVEDSEDLLIETSEPEALASDQGTNDANRVFGQLEVTFGDDVLVQVPGIKTHISGSVTYHWSGEPVPLARGHYGLKGTVDIYGPTLNIDNGRISFPDVPADNPVLNIRAQREIFGNTAVRSAGVQVIGNVKKPVVEAYTVPLTNEDRAWALLVTGSDFDQSQGVGGFDVGTYIAPRLYVSYGISLFDDENVISARYDLKKGFGIKVTSGEKESGVDISYTIDK